MLPVHCARCRAPLRQGARFCNACGAPVARPRAPSRWPWFLGIGLGGLLLAIAGLLVAWDRELLDMTQIGLSTRPFTKVEDVTALPPELAGLEGIFHANPATLAESVGGDAATFTMVGGAKIEVAKGAFSKSTRLRAAVFDMRSISVGHTRSYLYRIATDGDVPALGAPVELVVPLPARLVRAARIDGDRLALLEVKGDDKTARISIPHFSANSIFVKGFNVEWWAGSLFSGRTPEHEANAQRILSRGNSATQSFFGVGDLSKRSHNEMCHDMLQTLANFALKSGATSFPDDYPGGPRALVMEGTEMKAFFLASEQPSKTLYGGKPSYFHTKVAASTKLQGGPIAQTLLAAAQQSPTGQVPMSTLLRICIEKNGGNIALGVLACHNFTKEVTMAGRTHTALTTKDASGKLGTDDVPDDIAKLAHVIEPWRSESSRNPAGEIDKMGPLYHVFAAMAVTMWSTAGLFGHTAVRAEWALRVFHVGDDVPDFEKGAADACGESLAAMSGVGLGTQPPFLLPEEEPPLPPPLPSESGSADGGGSSGGGDGGVFDASASTASTGTPPGSTGGRDASVVTPPNASASVQPPPASSGDVLHVRVTDDKSGAPVSGASVAVATLAGASKGAVASNGDGRFDVNVLADGVAFTITKEGCQSKSVKFPRGTGALPKDPVPVKITCSQSAAPPSASSPSKPSKNVALVCEGQCLCCIGGTVEEITPLIKHCLNIGAESCFARCKRMVEQDNAAATVTEIRLSTCPPNR